MKKSLNAIFQIPIFPIHKNIKVLMKFALNLQLVTLLVYKLYLKTRNSQ